MLYGKKYKNHELRSLLISRAYDDYVVARTQHFEIVKDKLDEKPSCMLKDMAMI